MGWEKCVNSTKHTKDPYHTHAFEWNVHKRRSTLYILYPSNIICCFWCCKICGKAVWLNFFLFWQMMVHLLFNATLPTLNYKLYIHQFYNWISSNTFHNKIIAVLSLHFQKVLCDMKLLESLSKCVSHGSNITNTTYLKYRIIRKE